MNRKDLARTWLIRLVCCLVVSALSCFLAIPHTSRIVAIVAICYGLWPMELTTRWLAPRSVRLWVIAPVAYMMLCFAVAIGVCTGRWLDGFMLGAAGCVGVALGLTSRKWQDLEGRLKKALIEEELGQF